MAKMAASPREAIRQSDDLSDPITADLFTQISHALDKDLWFLEAHLEAKQYEPAASAWASPECECPPKLPGATGEQPQHPALRFGEFKSRAATGPACASRFCI